MIYRPRTPVGGDMSAPGLPGLRLMYLELWHATRTHEDNIGANLAKEVIAALTGLINEPSPVGYLDSERLVGKARELKAAADAHLDGFTPDNPFESDIAFDAFRLIEEHTARIEQDDADLRDRIHRPQARKALEFALRDSLILGHHDVRPEHLLLGLLRENLGTAISILTTHGVTHAVTRIRVRQLPGFRTEPARAVFTGYLAVKQTGPDYSFDACGLHLTREACEAEAPEGATVRRVRISIDDEPATHALTA